MYLFEWFNLSTQIIKLCLQAMFILQLTFLHVEAGVQLRY